MGFPNSVAPDWQPVTWDEEERGTGTYWGAALPDSFIQYATPNVAGEGGAKAPEASRHDWWRSALAPPATL